MTKRRVVVTGLGLISPVGITVSTAWDNLVAGKSGINIINDFDTTDYTTKFAGQIQDFDAKTYILAKDARKMDSFIQYGVAAGFQALDDARLKITNRNAHRVGISLGSGIGGLTSIENNSAKLLNLGQRKISPSFIVSAAINMAAGYLSILKGLKGPNFSVATACTTGAHSIGMAARIIAYGDADVMLAGGTEKASTPLGIGGFSAARALSRRNTAPQQASRPWDKGRDGFVLGDGAGMLVLEEYRHAHERGATIYAELVGFGMSADAFHVAGPIETGEGACLAMSNALQDARIHPNMVDYINAHGTSTIAGDLAETKAIKKLFGEHAYELVISSTKSMTGHLLGAAGAAEAVFTVMSLQQGIVPPTINLHIPDDQCDLDYAPLTARNIPNFNYALSNSFGFGGTNASLLFKKL